MRISGKPLSKPDVTRLGPRVAEPRNRLADPSAIVGRRLESRLSLVDAVARLRKHQGELPRVSPRIPGVKSSGRMWPTSPRTRHEPPRFASSKPPSAQIQTRSWPRLEIGSGRLAREASYPKAPWKSCENVRRSRWTDSAAIREPWKRCRPRNFAPLSEGSLASASRAWNASCCTPVGIRSSRWIRTVSGSC